MSNEVEQWPESIERWSETEDLCQFLNCFRDWHDDFGYSRSSLRAERLTSRLMASIDIHIVSELESEIDQRILQPSNKKFTARNRMEIFQNLRPDAGIEDAEAGDLPTEHPVEIWKALWIIRLVFTHCDGYIDRLEDRNKPLAQNAQQVFKVSISDDGFIRIPQGHPMSAHMARLRLTRALGTLDPWFDDRVSQTI